jgi:Protein of unknown function (DUF3617)
MAIPKRTLATLAALGLAFGSANAIAQNSDKTAVKADIANWSEAMSAAFTPGWWDGQMQAFDGDGKETESDSKPACIKPGEGNKMGQEVGGMFAKMVDNADCTSVSGGRGSLDLKLICITPNQTRIEFESNGTYSDGAVDWTVKFVTDSKSKAEAGSMKVSARRIRKSC